MPNIEKDLEKILGAKYGREVRGSIHDSIRDINEVVEGNVGTVTAIADRAEASAQRAETASAGVEVYAEQAQTYATSANESATSAQTSATSAQTSEANAKASEESATASASRALASENKAKTSETNAQTAEANAQASATSAQNSATSAQTSATNAQSSATNAQALATEAQTSETNAKASETASASAKILAESYARGGTGSRAGEDTDNAKYYMEQAKEAIGGDYIPRSEKGSPSGVATLGADGKIPSSQINGETYTSEEKTKLAGIATGANKTTVDSALSTTSTNPIQNKVITAEINTLKKSVSDGKILVANAITEKGVETATDATFAVMAENIMEISAGERHGASIGVTTTETTLLNKVCQLKLNGEVIQEQTINGNGSCMFTDIIDIGTYEVTATDGIETSSDSVVITAEDIVLKTVQTVSIAFSVIITFTLYSAVNDTVYYKENGQNVTLCTTDSTGMAENVQLNIPKEGLNLTLYSSVADNPDNVSEKYSKNVTFTKSTSDMLFMPEGLILYWYGYHNLSLTGGVVFFTQYVNGTLGTNSIVSNKTNNGRGLFRFANNNILNSNYSSVHVLAKANPYIVGGNRVIPLTYQALSHFTGATEVSGAIQGSYIATSNVEHIHINYAKANVDAKLYIGAETNGSYVNGIITHYAYWLE